MTLPRPRLLFWAVSLPVLLLDQWTKDMILERLHFSETIAVIPGCFNLTRVHNTGIAFGLLQGHNEWLAFVMIGLLLVAVWFASQLDWSRGLINLTTGLILAGGLGNGIDRWRYGSVVDFIDVYWKQWHWPAFNVADSAICIAVALLVVEELRRDKSSAKNNESEN